MKKQEALDYFKSEAELARQSGCTPQAVNQWGDTVPEMRAARLDKATKGKLNYDPAEYKLITAKK